MLQVLASLNFRLFLFSWAAEWLYFACGSQLPKADPLPSDCNCEFTKQKTLKIISRYFALAFYVQI